MPTNLQSKARWEYQLCIGELTEKKRKIVKIKRPEC